jgi:DNA-binding NtrC family response regulator
MRVLVVDDHGQCRETAARLLALLGFEAVTASDEREAREQLARYRGELAFVMLDLYLGPTEGTELSSRLQREHPELPVLFMSGYCKEVLEAMELLDRDRHFIEKPFSMNRLANAIEALLDQPLEPGGFPAHHAA